MHGNTIYLCRLLFPKRPALNRANLCLDVPDLRHGCLHPPRLPPDPPPARPRARCNLQRRHLLFRILKRQLLKKERTLSVGLQQCSGEYRRRDPARLRPFLDGGRALVRAHPHPQGCTLRAFLTYSFLSLSPVDRVITHLLKPIGNYSHETLLQPCYPFPLSSGSISFVTISHSTHI